MRKSTTDWKVVFQLAGEDGRCGSCSVVMTGRRRSGMGIRRGMEPFAVASIGRGESKALQFALLVDPSLPNTLHLVKSLMSVILCFCSAGERRGTWALRDETTARRV